MKNLKLCFVWMCFVCFGGLAVISDVRAQSYTTRDLTQVVRAIYQPQTSRAVTLSTGERIDLSHDGVYSVLNKLLAQSPLQRRHLEGLMQQYGISKQALDTYDPEGGDPPDEPSGGQPTEYVPTGYRYYDTKSLDGGNGHFTFYYVLNGSDAVADPCADTVIKLELPDGTRTHTSAGTNASECNDYTRSNAPDYVELMGIYLEYSLAKYLEMGFTSRVLDQPVLNPDESRKYVFIEELTDFLGWTCTGCHIHLANDLSDDASRFVTAHELFHQVQSSYTSSYEPWVSEGTARWAEDAVFDAVNSYAGHAKGYLNNPQQRLQDKSYEAVLFWKYFAEHFGRGQREPERGVDAITMLWNNMVVHEPEEAVDATLAMLGHGHLDLYDVFSDCFGPANYLLHRSGTIPTTYTYTEAANYKPVKVLNEHATNVEPHVPWAFPDSTVQGYGLDYYSLDGLSDIETVMVQVVAGAPMTTQMVTLYTPSSGWTPEIVELPWGIDYSLNATYPQYTMQGTWGQVWTASFEVHATAYVEEIGIILSSTRTMDYTLLVDGTPTLVVGSGGVLSGPRGGRGKVAEESSAQLNQQTETTLPSTSLQLAASYPNPFAEETTIAYQLPQAWPVALHVYDLLGQRVATLVEEPQEAGPYSVRWNGMNDSGQRVVSGTYLYVLQAGSQVVSRTLQHIR